MDDDKELTIEERIVQERILFWLQRSRGSALHRKHASSSCSSKRCSWGSGEGFATAQHINPPEMCDSECWRTMSNRPSTTITQRAYHTFNMAMQRHVAQHFGLGIYDERRGPLVYWVWGQLDQRDKEGHESDAYYEFTSCVLGYWSRWYFADCQVVLVKRDWHISPEERQRCTTSADPTLEHFTLEIRGHGNRPYPFINNEGVVEEVGTKQTKARQMQHCSLFHHQALSFVLEGMREV